MAHRKLEEIAGATVCLFWIVVEEDAGGDRIPSDGEGSKASEQGPAVPIHNPPGCPQPPLSVGHGPCVSLSASS